MSLARASAVIGILVATMTALSFLYSTAQQAERNCHAIKDIRNALVSTLQGFAVEAPTRREMNRLNQRAGDFGKIEC